ncbi:protein DETOXIFICATION 46, chloroplastic-like [Andrographis paniculata]|uniref:protein DETOXIFICATION 46, chloroplastic-like n=1 Tax=Andrographis paniculata TaxID=175694 RepID=UPI0021E73642|nr:protein DETOXIFICATION 46, chloroplastic-like [Andrographis paniculata]
MSLKSPIHQFCTPRFEIARTSFGRNGVVSRSGVRYFRLKSNRIFISCCASPIHEVAGRSIAPISQNEEEEEEEEGHLDVAEKVELVKGISEAEASSENESLWSQMVEIAKFSGPAVGLWICGPMMSLIDTAVVGQGSSTELAALGPGTVLCDNTSYVFMFLSIATSNLVATSLARQDRNEVQHQISMLLFIGLACGFLMLFCTRLYGQWALTAFTGAKNAEIITAANTYVQIRGLAWPAILVGWVAQSASLGMKDSWGPLKALAAASVINGIGDIVLCRFLDYGIAGAAWATMVSQVVAAYMMVEALNSKGYNGYAITVPSPNELLQIFSLAAPVFVTMMSKVAFYSLLVYFATSMGTKTVAAHQVMIQVYCMCTVFGEPLSQTSQSFMPELICGVNQNLAKARTLLKSLVIIGAASGLILGCIGTSVPWLFPKIFSPDLEVIQEMHKVLIPFFLALCITPSTHSLEGTLMAGRDLKFLSMSMGGIFCLGSLVLLLASSRAYSLSTCWFTLVAFQWSRFLVALRRLTLRNGILYNENATNHKLKSA